MTLRVITATRGMSAHLAATVASVAAVPGARHILVAPAAAGADLARKFPGLTVLAENGTGLYAALNTGLDAPGDEALVTWINDDDLLVAPGLAAALAGLAADAALGAVYGRVELIDADTRRLGELPVAHRAADLLPLLAAGLMPLAQPGTVFRRSALAPLGRFDPSFRLAGDLDLFVRALRAGVGFGFVDAVVARFRLHGGQLSKDEVAAALEHARIVETLPRGPAFAPRLRFRGANLRVYLERVRRHGFVRMQSLYRHD
jgi:succinoglycan biosynthesis protein ExoU